MAIHRLLFLDAQGLTAYREHGATPQAEATFSPDAEGLVAFEEYLARNYSSLFYLLADIADEGFQMEELPHVTGSDRDEMLKRKLAQYFYGTPLSLAMSLGRSKSGRRDEKFLLAGLTGYAQFEPWLQAIRNTETQLAGIYSVPFVLNGMIGKLADKSKPVLLMSVTRAGLRQTFFEGGQLRFSRLTPMATNLIGEVATACGTETRKIFQYLAGQRLVARDVPLTTLVLAHPNHFAIIADRCENTPERQLQLVDLLAETKKTGIKEQPTDSRCDALLLNQLARKAPAVQFAPAVERHPYRLWQFRFALKTMAAIVLAVGLIYAVSQTITQIELANSNGLLQAEVDMGKRRYDNMLHTLPEVPIGFSALRTLTDRYEALEKRSAGPEPMLQLISQALDKSPAVELSSLDWWIANTPNDNSKDSSGRGTIGSPSGPAAGNGYAIVRLQAQLPISMIADHRSQLDAVNTFAELLRSRNIEVHILTLPFETESEKSIRSTDTVGKVEPPRFALRLAAAL